MWAEVNGERKKVACGPCIRGHRSSKCDHRDRVLVEVRKPGRPLSSCPHPTGSCSCERVVINYTIPKTSECACPSNRPQSAVTPGSSSGRVQKSRGRKPTNTFNTAALERAVKVSQDGETDSSSLFTQTPPSESHSPPSSASSTPRLLPLRKNSQGTEPAIISASTPTSQPATTKSQGVSSCCQPKPAQVVQAPQGGGCCSSKKKQEPPTPVQPAKSCCGGTKSIQNTPSHFTQVNGPVNPHNGYPSFPAHPFQHQPYGIMSQSGNFVPMPPPPNFSTPIYNHVGSIYQTPTPSMPMAHTHSHSGTQAMEHNCHCGDSCSCFGCAAHPNNATMLEYVRSMHMWMSTGQYIGGPAPAYDLPTYPHHPGFGAETGLSCNNGPPNFMTTERMGFQSNPMTLPNVTSPWSQGSMATPTQATTPSLEANYFGPSNSATPTTSGPELALSLKVEESIQSPISTDSPSEGNEETVTLSPSSFFWQEVVLPGCNDATGTCQCGDGCECIGCLTHGGHNGVPLDMPAIPDQQDAFPNFLATNGAT